jgi:hypothetical protein
MLDRKVCGPTSCGLLSLPGQGGAPAAPEAGQKAVALRCLAGACESGQLLVDIFVNYDCDLEGANLFERLVLALVRTAQAAPSASDSPAVAADEAHVRLLVRVFPPFPNLVQGNTVI